MTEGVTAARPTGPDDPPIFYSLPVEQVAEGMSTDDGQDVIGEPCIRDHAVLFSVYTPADDPGEDEERRCSPEGRLKPTGTRVSLATFWNTSVDASRWPDAVIEHR